MHVLRALYSALVGPLLVSFVDRVAAGQGSLYRRLLFWLT